MGLISGFIRSILLKVLARRLPRNHLHDWVEAFDVAVFARDATLLLVGAR